MFSAPCQSEWDFVVFRVFTRALARKRVDNSHSASSITQDVMVKFLEYSRRRQVSYPFACLAKMVYDVAIDRRRRKDADKRGGKMTRNPTDCASLLATGSFEADQIVVARELEERLFQVLSPSEYEIAQRLRCDYSRNEIAVFLGLSKGVLATIIKRVQRKIKLVNGPIDEEHRNV